MCGISKKTVDNKRRWPYVNPALTQHADRFVKRKRQES